MKPVEPERVKEKPLAPGEVRERERETHTHTHTHTHTLNAPSLTCSQEIIVKAPLPKEAMKITRPP